LRRSTSIATTRRPRLGLEPEAYRQLSRKVLARDTENIRSANGPGLVAKELRKWLGNVGTGTLYIEPGSPWENGYWEGFN
jgi:hypothetical protein